MSQKLKRDFAHCCSGIYDADLIGGNIVLTCVRCGLNWKRLADGTFESFTATEPVQQKVENLGRQLSGNAQRI